MQSHKLSVCQTVALHKSPDASYHLASAALTQGQDVGWVALLTAMVSVVLETQSIAPVDRWTPACNALAEKWMRGNCP